MENFFYNDKFYIDLNHFVNDMDLEENISELESDWQVKVELTDLEPIFKLDADSLCEMLSSVFDERFSEDGDEEEKILKALKECIDFDKLKISLPQLHYPNNKFVVITKSDLVDYLK